jgi:hypothetical protein
VPTGLIYEVRGGPVGQPFILPDSFPAARTALAERFQSARQGVTAVLGDMERLAVGLGMLSRGREAFRNPREGFGALFKLAPMVRDWHRSVTQLFDRAFGSDEAVKCALAANLPYWHDDPDTLWWILFGVAAGDLHAHTVVPASSPRLTRYYTKCLRGRHIPQNPAHRTAYSSKL